MANYTWSGAGGVHCHRVMQVFLFLFFYFYLFFQPYFPLDICISATLNTIIVFSLCSQWKLLHQYFYFGVKHFKSCVSSSSVSSISNLGCREGRAKGLRACPAWPWSWWGVGTGVARVREGIVWPVINVSHSVLWLANWLCLVVCA